MTVASMLKGKEANIFSLTPAHTIADAAALLAEKRIGAAIVVDGRNGLVGILSERDIVRGLANEGPDILARPVSELMTAKVETCTTDETTDQLMRRMTDGRFRHLPVVDGGAVIGVVSIGDVVKSRIRELENETEAMRHYIAGHG